MQAPALPPRNCTAATAKPEMATSSAAATNQFVYLRICRASTLPVPTEANPNPPSHTQAQGHLYFIEGFFSDISRYAGSTSDWMLRIAQLICDPLGAGQVFANTTGTSEEWHAKDRTEDWRIVLAGDPLLPAVYEYQPERPIVLSKISERHNHSRSTSGATNSATFHNHIELRDGNRCVICQDPVSPVPSRFIPKRLGDNGAAEVITRFVGAQDAAGTHRYDPRFGALLIRTLDTRVDDYELGFYHSTHNTYILHNFNVKYPNMTLFGTLTPQLELLHGHSTTLHNFDTSQIPVPLPPPGVLNWHYMQCVIKRFGTAQYKNLPDIEFTHVPFRTSSDSSDEASFDDDNPPYPSYLLEKAFSEIGRPYWDQEERKEIMQWASNVS